MKSKKKKLLIVYRVFSAVVFILGLKKNKNHPSMQSDHDRNRWKQAIPGLQTHSNCVFLNPAAVVVCTGWGTVCVVDVFDLESNTLF